MAGKSLDGFSFLTTPHALSLHYFRVYLYYTDCTDSTDFICMMMHFNQNVLVTYVSDDILKDDLMTNGKFYSDG